MKTFLISYLTSLFSILLLDAVWLGLIAKGFYAQHLGHLMRSSFVLRPAALFYAVYALGITVLIVLPGMQGGSWMRVVGMGALLGLCAYAAYNGTNLATLKDWPASITLIDLLWGTAMTAAASAATYLVVSRLS